MFGSVLHVSTNGDIDEDVVDKNVKAINKALKETVKARDYQSLEITKNDVDVMVNIYQILAALERGITIMGGQSYGTGSSVLPFLTQFLEFLPLLIFRGSEFPFVNTRDVIAHFRSKRSLRVGK